MSFGVSLASCSARLHGCDAALNQVAGDLLQLGARELHLQVLGAGGVRRDERQIDLGLHHRRKLDLGFLGGFLQALQRLAVVAQVNALLLLELVGHVIDDALIEVVAAQERVAVGGLDFKHAFAHVEDRDVERAAAQVIHGDRFVLLLVQAVRQRRSRRLVDDAQHFQARDLACVFGRLPLADR